MVVEIGGTPPQVIKREQLFEDRYVWSADLSMALRDAFSSGDGFLMMKSIGSAGSSLTMLVNWQRLPALRKSGSKPK